MKPLALTLCLLCLAPVQRKGAESLVLMARQGARQKMLQSAAQAAQAIPTNVVVKAVVKPPPVPVTNVWLTFTLPHFGYNFQQSNTFYEVAWTTNLQTAQTKVPIDGLVADWMAMPRGWTHYCYTSTNVTAFGNTNKQAYFIIRAYNTATGWYSPWATVK